MFSLRNESPRPEGGSGAPGGLDVASILRDRQHGINNDHYFLRLGRARVICGDEGRLKLQNWSTFEGLEGRNELMLHVII